METPFAYDRLGDHQDRFLYTGSYCLDRDIYVQHPQVGQVKKYREITLSECEELCAQQQSYCGMVFYMPYDRWCIIQPSRKTHNNRSAAECKHMDIVHTYTRQPASGNIGQ